MEGGEGKAVSTEPMDPLPPPYSQGNELAEVGRKVLGGHLQVLLDDCLAKKKREDKGRSVVGVPVIIMSSLPHLHTPTNTNAPISLSLTGHAQVKLVLGAVLVGEVARGQRPQAEAEGPDVGLGGELVCSLVLVLYWLGRRE